MQRRHHNLAGSGIFFATHWYPASVSSEAVPEPQPFIWLAGEISQEFGNPSPDILTGDGEVG